jgi:integrase
MVDFTVSPEVVNGVFATAKSDGRQRLVVDARPANQVWGDAPELDLPSPDLLAGLELPPGKKLLAAKVDLDNYYHRLALPQWMWPFFALPPVRAAEVGMGDAFGDKTMIFPCCTTLPMGWSHSAYLAQKAHENLLDVATELRPADRIKRDTDLRLDRPRHLVYIDDLVLVGLEEHASALKRLQSAYCTAMSLFSLPHKPSKLVLPTSCGVKCIGVELHGDDRTAGVAPTELTALANTTTALLRRGHCTGLQLSTVVGSWSWAFLARRASFAVFSSVYRFIEAAGRRRFQIWPSVARELQMAAHLAPLLFTDLSAQWFPKTVATDASSEGQGVVAVQMQQDKQSYMSRAPLPAWWLKPENREGCRELHPYLQGARWRTIVSSRWAHEEHINILEARALTTAVKWAISSPSSLGARLLLWSDSTVVVGAARKGRSSAFRLLAILRSLAALLLSTGINAYFNWIPTEKNPADGPSRRFKFDSTLGFPGEGPARFLFPLAFSDNTRRKYTRCVRDFVAWLDRNRASPASVADLDENLCDYFHDLYLTGAGTRRSTAEATISGLAMFLPELKRALPMAALALRGWRREVPSVPHPPLTWDLAVAIAVHMATTGLFNLGVGVLLAFECYLRVGELVTLSRRDVIMAGDLRLGGDYHGTALRLARTKTGKNQEVEVRCPQVTALLRTVLESTPKHRSALLFPVSTSTFRRYFKSSCAALGLSPCYVPHSLRHGGATRDYLRRLPLEEILRHGRWTSTKSARHYIQMGKALLIATDCPRSIVNLAAELATDVVGSLALAQRHFVVVGESPRLPRPPGEASP